MRNLKFLLLLFITIVNVSCNDDLLSVSNPNRISTSTFWQDLGDTNSGLAAVYNDMLDEDILLIRTEAFRSDMGWPGFGRPLAGDDGLRSVYDLAYPNSASFIQSKWDACYKTIFGANQVIEALERIKDDTSDDLLDNWISQMGQARFIRGLMHFYLHTAFNKGSVVIRNSVPVTIDEFNKPLSTSEEVKTFFRADLEYAYDNLVTVYEVPEENLGRVTKGAAATILGTSYLYDENYEKAMVYFDDIINNVTADYGYKLVDDLAMLFTTAGEFNSESILELNYTIEYRNDLTLAKEGVLTNTLAAMTIGNKAPTVPAWLINAYKKDAMDFTDDRNYVEDLTAASGRRLRSVSLRTSSMIAIADDDNTDLLYYGDVTGTKIKTSNSGWGFGYSKKYTNHDIYKGEGEVDPRGARASGKNVVVNRLSDVYLMQAECLIKTGDISGALELINEIRYRWALVLLGPPNSKWPNSSFDEEQYDQETLMNRLMYIEKPLEMYLEGNAIRWYDLRRWGIISTNFSKLASETYYASSVTINNLAGASVTKSNASISDDPGAASGLNVIDYEYDVKASNYRPEDHDYYPIPFSEIVRNPNIN